MSDDSEVAAWWWRPEHGTNFGDELGPEILRRQGWNLKRVPIEQAELVIGGSVLQIVEGKNVRDGLVVWGSGLISNERIAANRKIDHQQVRGALTRDALGLPEDTCLGDAALMVHYFFDPSHVVPYRVGFVQHYVDDRPAPWADVRIFTTNNVAETIALITSCEFIVSSSLHGLIVAQAFGIRALWWPHPKVIGGDFKWLDYSTGATGPGMLEDPVI